MPRKGSENKMYVFPPIDGISIKICKCKTNFHSWIYSLSLYVSDYICFLYNYTWIVNCQILRVKVVNSNKNKIIRFGQFHLNHHKMLFIKINTRQILIDE